MNPITVNTKAFVRELEWCARFIERKTTIPVLSNVMLRNCQNGMLHFTATDLELGAQTSIEADGPEFEGTVPVHMLLKYLKKVDDRELRLIPNIRYDAIPYGPHVEGCTGAMEGCCLDGIRFVGLGIQHGDEEAEVNIEGMSIDSYPELPSRPLSSIEIGGLETAIPRAVIAVSADESRFTLNGALLRIDTGAGTVQLISTDGHRLSAADAKLNDVEWHKRHDPVKSQTLIPKQALVELVRLGDSAFFCHDEHHAFFTVGERTIIARKLTGNFPDFERVLPTEFKYAVTVASAQFKKLVDRVSVFADKRSHAVELSVNGSLSIATLQHNRNATGQVPFTGPTFAYPYCAGFNAYYLTDFLKTACAESFEFRFNRAVNAAECGVKGWRYVLMPMRMGDEKSDPVAEGECEPVPAVIAYLQAQAVEATAALESACDQCGDSISGATETDLCPPCDATWERATPDVPVTPAPPVAQGTEEGFIDAYQLATLLGINVATVYNRVKRGSVPPPEKHGRKMVWVSAQFNSAEATA